jgi:membrane associated rhomboid family serine protease
MVIPIHDDNPVRRVPVVTYLLIALNFAVFFTEPVVSQLGIGSTTIEQACTESAYFERYGAIPSELTTNEPQKTVLSGEPDADGTGCATTSRDYDKSPFLSVLFAMFLHGGWLHILGNMLFLWVFGNNVEDRMGRLRFLLFYLFCGYIATYGFASQSPHSATSLVGASGAIAGVLGAYLVLYPRARVTSIVPIAIILLPLRLPAWLVLGGWFLLQWVYANGSAVADGAGVAYAAHVFGFITGVVIAAAARPALLRNTPVASEWF